MSYRSSGRDRCGGGVVYGLQSLLSLTRARSPDEAGMQAPGEFSRILSDPATAPRAGANGTPGLASGGEPTGRADGARQAPLPPARSPARMREIALRGTGP